MELPELYQEKGQLMTTIEVAQARLQGINQQIVEKLNASETHPETIPEEE